MEYYRRIQLFTGGYRFLMLYAACAHSNKHTNKNYLTEMYNIRVYIGCWWNNGVFIEIVWMKG